MTPKIEALKIYTLDELRVLFTHTGAAEKVLALALARPVINQAIEAALSQDNCLVRVNKENAVYVQLQSEFSSNLRFYVEAKDVNNQTVLDFCDKQIKVSHEQGAAMIAKGYKVTAGSAEAFASVIDVVTSSFKQSDLSDCLVIVRFKSDTVNTLGLDSPDNMMSFISKDREIQNLVAAFVDPRIACESVKTKSNDSPSKKAIESMPE